MNKVILIDPRPAQHDAMVALLQENAPVIGIEFTLPKLAHLLTANIDGQHNANGGQAAIELALTCELPSEDSTFAIVRPDPDALGAIVVLEMRLEETREPYLGFSRWTEDRIRYIAKQDAFQFGAWPGPRPVASLVSDKERILFNALSNMCMNAKESIESRILFMMRWLMTGESAGLAHAIEQVEANYASALSQTEFIESSDSLVVIRAYTQLATQLATQIAYCVAPVCVVFNEKFRFPNVEGEHLKYTVCQFQPNQYVDLVAVLADLQAMEKDWGGGPGIIGSPQGISSTLTPEQVSSVVKAHLK